MKKAFITGVTGQDGAYLTQYLLLLGYEVYGLIRRTSRRNFENLADLGVLGHSRLKLLEGDVLDGGNLARLMLRIQPDEVYHLAAQSHVGASFLIPEVTTETICRGTLNVLSAVRSCCPDAKFYNAASSEMFGKVHETPQRETTPFHPRSPYGCAKVFGYDLTRQARESGVFACSGILFNHESPIRGSEFVTRKISLGVAAMVTRDGGRIALGNLDAKRDWGFAGEYVQAMHAMLYHSEPDDYVIATGETHSIREFLVAALKAAELPDPEDLDRYTTQSANLVRPTDVDILQGDASKAEHILGWKPTVRFEALVKFMVEMDIRRMRNGTVVPPKEG